MPGPECVERGNPNVHGVPPRLLIPQAVLGDTIRKINRQSVDTFDSSFSY